MFGLHWMVKPLAHNTANEVTYMFVKTRNSSYDRLPDQFSLKMFNLFSFSKISPMKKNKYIAPTIDLVNINVEFVCQSGPSLTPGSSPGDAWEADSKSLNTLDLDNNKEVDN